MKYWNKERIRRQNERKRLARDRAFDRKVNPVRSSRGALTPRSQSFWHSSPRLAAGRFASNGVKTERQRTSYTKGATQKNALLMLDVLGSERNRKLLERLQRGGAMSVSKMVEPFSISLPLAMQYIQKLERVGLIITHKRGRVRMCIYNQGAVRELGNWLLSRSAFDG